MMKHILTSLEKKLFIYYYNAMKPNYEAAENGNTQVKQKQYLHFMVTKDRLILVDHW